MLSRIVFFWILALVLVAQEDPKVLLEQADTALDSGKYAVALEKADQAATAFGKAANPKERAHALTTSGLALMYSGEYLTAVEHFETALRIARENRDFGPEIARLNDIGNALYFRGQYSDAMSKYQEALDRVHAVPNDKWTAWGRQLTTANIAILYQTVGQYEQALSLYSGLLASGQNLAASEHAQMLSNIGVLRRRLGDPQKALETYRAAQDIYRKAMNRDGEISVLNNIGIVQAMDFQDLRTAQATFTQSLNLATESGSRPLAIHARLYRGETLYRAGRLDASEVDFKNAAGEAKELGQQEEEWKALYGLARVAKAQGDEAETKRVLHQAVERIESLRQKAGGPSLRSTFLADKRAVYDMLIESSVSEKEVFHWMEESRARTLKDRRGTASWPSLEEVQRSLPADTAVIEYWLGEDSAAVLWFTNRQVGFRRWKPDPGLYDRMNRALEILSNPTNSRWKFDLEPLSRELLEGIPILSDSQIRRLRIVPDGVLTTIPFEALAFHHGLLVERFAISYASSMQIGSSTLGGRFRWPWQRVITVVADPQPATATSGQFGDSRIWAPLPQTRHEASEITRALGGASSVHTGADATKRWVERPGAPILHLATHAMGDPSSQESSFIVLSPTSTGQRFGYVFFKEIESLSLGDVDLVTLSACETNVGKLVAGEGAQTLSQAVLSAGARSTVSSLWKVGDRSTAELMIRFYAGLAAGRTVEDALRQAKLDFLAAGASAHPAHWAAFTLAGDAYWTLPRLISWWWFAAGGLLLAAILGIAFAKLKLR